MDWTNHIIEKEAQIRLMIFFGTFSVIAAWELLLPRRTNVNNKPSRWKNNLSLAFLNTLFLRFLIPFSAVSIAYSAHNLELGILSLLDLPSFLEGLIFFVFMDLVIYGQHRCFHQIPILWKIHKVHHTDLEFDVSTGIRFHPLEIFLSIIIKGGTIFILGPPLVAVIIFEVALNASSMFNHGNIFISRTIDRFLRLIVVTPDMHRIHHSCRHEFYTANFGFNLSWWDFIFKSYKNDTPESPESMQIGLEEFNRFKDQNSLLKILKIPFH